MATTKDVKVMSSGSGSPPPVFHRHVVREPKVTVKDLDAAHEWALDKYIGAYKELAKYDSN